MSNSTSSAHGLEIADVAFGYASSAPVIEACTLRVPRGTVHGVLGCSGCGKTTLLRLIAGLERLDSGSIHVEGIHLAGEGHHLAPEQRPVGMVFQDYALFPNRSVRKNVMFGMSEGSKRDRLEQADSLLQRVGLLDLADRMPHTLSGGQQQRTAIARSLARKPRLMLLDEPFSSLDAETRSDTREETMAILRASQVTTLVVTHDPAEAELIADEVTWLTCAQDADRS